MYKDNKGTHWADIGGEQYFKLHKHIKEQEKRIAELESDVAYMMGALQNIRESRRVSDARALAFKSFTEIRTRQALRREAESRES